MFTSERELSNSSHFGNQQSGHGWQGLDYEAFPTPSRPIPFPSPTLSDHTVDPRQPAGVTSVPTKCRQALASEDGAARPLPKGHGAQTASGRGM